MKVIVLFLLWATLGRSEPANLKLKFVQVLFRHGSRIPDLEELYPNDPLNDFLKGQGLGQLTEVGKLNSYRLGEILRHRYGDLVGREYNSNAIAVQSSSSERTILTAKLVLNGMFAQPIPGYSNYTVIIKPYELDLLYYYCPVYLKELNRVLNSSDEHSVLESNENLLQYLLLHTGRCYKSTTELLLLYVALLAKKALNLPLPLWTQEVYGQLEYIANLRLGYEHYNQLMNRLNGGRMLQRIIGNMENAILGTSGSEERKMILYSAHDFNVAAVLFALNGFETHFPKFNSFVVVELYEQPINKNHYVKLLYYRDVFTDAEVLSIPSCNVLCNFTSFKTILEPNVPLNYTKECKSSVTLD